MEIDRYGLEPKSAEAVEAINAERFSRIAQQLYEDGPLLARKSQHWRPFICPFESLVGYVRDASQVLDIGCGAGLLLSLAAGLGFEFEGIGFDSSQRAIDLAMRMAQRAAVLFPNARLSFQRMRDFSEWPRKTFDVVFLIDVLHHVAPSIQHDFLLHATSRVRSGGIFVYKDMCLRPWWRAQANRLHDLALAGERIAYVPIQTAEQWAKEDDMDVIVRANLNRFWYGHELRVFRKSGGGRRQETRKG